MGKPFISIIIPFFNSIDTIEETIQSILDQNHDDYEILVIDDGSSDEMSKQWLDKVQPERCTIYRLPHAGPSSARNYGISIAKGEYLLFLDSDDLLAENSLPNVSKILTKEHPDWLLGNCKITGKTTKIRYQMLPTKETQLLFNQIPICNYIKKSLVFDAGLFDEGMNLLGLEDWELWIRVLEKNPRITLYPHILFIINERFNSRTTNEAKLNQKSIMKYVVSKHGELYYRALETKYYELKMTLETPDFRIGNVLLKPYRFFKKFFT